MIFCDICGEDHLDLTARAHVELESEGRSITLETLDLCHDCFAFLGNTIKTAVMDARIEGREKRGLYNRPSNPRKETPASPPERMA